MEALEVVRPRPHKTPGKATWEFCVTLHRGRGGQIRRRGFRTRAAAEAVLDEVFDQLKTEAETGVPATAGDQPLIDYLRLWLAGHNGSPGQIDQHKWAIETHLAPGLATMGNPTLRGFNSAAQVMKLMGTLSRKDGRPGPLAPNSRFHVQKTLNAALNSADRARLIVRNPLDFVDRQHKESAEDPELTVWTEEEATRFLASALEDELCAVFFLELLRDMRPEEVLGLQWPDVNLDEGYLIIRRGLSIVSNNHYALSEGKTAGRRVELDPILVDLLKAHRARQAEAKLAAPEWSGQITVRMKKRAEKVIDGKWVFAWTTADRRGRTGHRPGQPIKVGVVRKRFYKAVERAGVPPLRQYDMRHTGITLMLLRGEHAKVVAELAGHSVKTMMTRYAHFLPTLHGEAGARHTAALLNPAPPDPEITPLRRDASS